MKGLCVLDSGDSQCFVPLHDVCIALVIKHFYLILLHKLDICDFICKKTLISATVAATPFHCTTERNILLS